MNWKRDPESTETCGELPASGQLGRDVCVIARCGRGFGLRLRLSADLLTAGQQLQGRTNAEAVQRGLTQNGASSFIMFDLTRII